MSPALKVRSGDNPLANISNYKSHTASSQNYQDQLRMFQIVLT